MVAQTRLGIENYVASEPESRSLDETQAQRFEMGEQTLRFVAAYYLRRKGKLSLQFKRRAKVRKDCDYSPRWAFRGLI